MVIVSWNVEGLRKRPMAEVMERLEWPDVLCLQEIRLREIDTAEVHALATALPDYSFVHSLANDSKNARFRGGRTYGVGTFVRNSLDPILVTRQAWDREGRVTVVVVPAANLAIVNVYAVNGTDKPYWDHDAGAFAGDRHAFKRAFHDRIATLGESLKRQTLDLLLIGDWNVSQAKLDTTPRLRTEEPHATSRAHFRSTVVEGLDVVDVFRALNPEARAYTWFNPRSRRLDAARVDFALLSRSRLDDVRSATIAEYPIQELGSDHAPLTVEVGRPDSSRSHKKQ